MLGLIFVLALVALFALEQARREQWLARFTSSAMQIEQSCLSLGSSLIRMVAEQPIDSWSTLVGSWCLANNSELHQTCPKEFAGVSNWANIRLLSDTQLHIATTAQAHGTSCGETIELLHHQGEVLVKKRLRTHG